MSNYYETIRETFNELSLSESIKIFKDKIFCSDSLGWYANITDIKNKSKQCRADIKSLKALKADIDLVITDQLKEIESNKNLIEKKRAEAKL